MRRIDVLGILFGVVVLLIVLLAFAAKRKFKGDRTECPYHLKMAYVAYETARSDFGKPAGLLDKYTQSREFDHKQPEVFFRLLCSNGLGLAETICPLDNRRVAVSVPTLVSSNLSYFISASPNSGDPYRILAGNRNIAASKRLIDLTTNRITGWDASQGLHRANGFLLFGDGSVGQVSASELSRRAGLPSNHTNVLAVP